MSIPEKKLADRVLEFRKGHGWSQEELANAIGQSRNYVSMIEGGRDAGKNFIDKFVKFAALVHDSGHNPRAKLAVALAIRGMTVGDLAKKIGYDSGVINGVINGTSRASEAMIEKIVNIIPTVSKEDLMSGSEETAMIREGIPEIYGAKPAIILPPGLKGRMIPLLSNAQAGAWDAGHSDEGWHGECFFALNVDDRRAFAIRVVGNSMEPEIREGDVVVCSPMKEVYQGCCAVIRTKSDQAFVKFWFKKGDMIVLESANPDYEPIRFPQGEIAGAWPVIQRTSSGFIQKGV